MNVKQVKLEQGNRRLVCWVEDRKSVKEGNSLSLKGIEGFWKISSVGPFVLDQSQLNTKWAVGGL